jgi:hypothetical protein
MWSAVVVQATSHFINVAKMARRSMARRFAPKVSDHLKQHKFNQKDVR